MTAMARPARGSAPQSHRPWRALSAGAGVAGGEVLAGITHPALGGVLAAADVLGPLVIALVLLTAILRGSDQTCERVFRLLRWAANRREPPAPRPPGSSSSPPSHHASLS